MQTVQDEWNFSQPTLLGYVPGRNGSILSQGARRFPDAFKQVKAAALGMNLDVDGALVAVGVKRLPVGEGVRATSAMAISTSSSPNASISVAQARRNADFCSSGPAFKTPSTLWLRSLRVSSATLMPGEQPGRLWDGGPEPR